MSQQYVLVAKRPTAYWTVLIGASLTDQGERIILTPFGTGKVSPGVFCPVLGFSFQERCEQVKKSSELQK